ncbi:MAG: hypothetical protein UHG68_05485 [Clostridia bacterium]|nr:hypothetical protein [Clostridia bacterium]
MHGSSLAPWLCFRNRKITIGERMGAGAARFLFLQGKMAFSLDKIRQ